MDNAGRATFLNVVRNIITAAREKRTEAGSAAPTVAEVAKAAAGIEGMWARQQPPARACVRHSVGRS